MIDLYGKWIEEEDYSHYPKEKWCFMDYMAYWIRGQDYKIETDIENLIDMAEAHFSVHSLDNGSCSCLGSIEEWAKNVQEFIIISGGLREFDYYC